MRTLFSSLVYYEPRRKDDRIFPRITWQAKRRMTFSTPNPRKKPHIKPTTTETLRFFWSAPSDFGFDRILCIGNGLLRAMGCGKTVTTPFVMVIGMKFSSGVYVCGGGLDCFSLHPTARLENIFPLCWGATY